ncbi:hypothetical protein FA15DRAFT_716668 [Coprinopsis marcescibilis]|uniref:Uncharacterized protein n=1 Tax=Coprinopsis marcescibilis TaxID=230819 RepID=A0A5C3L6V5_COPMA|nr:hypothetical protein FA15DRAFT_716668 [Coprinopsis marcescibilis]
MASSAVHCEAKFAEFVSVALPLPLSQYTFAELVNEANRPLPSTPAEGRNTVNIYKFWTRGFLSMYKHADQIGYDETEEGHWERAFIYRVRSRIMHEIAQSFDIENIKPPKYMCDNAAVQELLTRKIYEDWEDLSLERSTLMAEDSDDDQDPTESIAPPSHADDNASVVPLRDYDDQSGSQEYETHALETSNSNSKVPAASLRELFDIGVYGDEFVEKVREAIATNRGIKAARRASMS